MTIFDKTYYIWRPMAENFFLFHCPVVLKYETNKVKLKGNIALNNMITIMRK